MPHYGILREYRFEDLNDVRGSEVYGVNDEKLGTIDDVVFDHSTGDIRYVVLKTGVLFGKKIIVPANRIESYGNHEDKFYADLDKERLEMLPEFDDHVLKSEGDWSIYEKEYQSRLNSGAVMYNKDTGRVVTPPVQEVEGTRTQPLSNAGIESLDRDFTPQRMGHEDTLLGVSGSPSEKTTLQPQKASIAGKEDVVSNTPIETREGISSISSNINIAREGRDARLDNAALDAAAIDSARLEAARAMRTNEDRINADPMNDVRNEARMNEARIDSRSENLREYAEGRASEAPVPARPLREVTDTMGGEMEVPVEEEGARINSNLREPGIYRVNRTDVNAGSNLNSRWSAFQDRLRARRDKIIVDCPDCGSQEKVA
jgi:sporulation protein YlmC with PRC-barrel domain